MVRMSTFVSGVAILAMAFGLLACDEPKEEAAAASASATSAAPAPEPEPETVPNMLVDDRGPVVGTNRVKEDVEKELGKKELKKLLEGLPYDDEPVMVRVLKQAKVAHVVEMLFALGDAGAKAIVVKTDPPRDGLPGELRLTPEQQLGGEIEPCSVTAMVNADLNTGVWEFKGGMGTRHLKGLAGPDLSNTQETIKKKLDRCDSKVGFVSAAGTLPWEHAFALAAQFAPADEKKKLEHLVLLGKEPVGGQKVELRK